MAARLKGQEVEVILLDNGNVVDTLTDVKDAEFEVELEIKTEGYLGEPSNRKDNVMNGAKASMTVHHEDAAVFDFLASVIGQAQRRVPGRKVNVKGTLNYPNGSRRRILLADVSIGAIPIGFGGRTDYGTIKLNCESSTVAFV